MNCYRRSKFAYDTFRNFSTKLVCRNSVHPPAPRITSNSSSLFYSPFKSSAVLFRSNQVYSKLENLSGIKQNQSSLHSVFTRRYYYVDRQQIHHFKPRGYYREFFEDPRNMLIVAGSCALILITTAIYFGKSEVVPYTKRKHFVLLPRRLEERIGKYQFNQMQKSFKGEILPPTHPQSVRVGQIVTGINDALQRHEKLNWEVVVVDEPGTVNAYCFPDGKIVVFTGLLEHFKNDAEIATIVGHEVGHAVARHFAEKITKTMSLAVLPLLLCHYVMPDLLYHYYRDRLSSLLFSRPFSQKMEMEADYIGLLLMASAGYDPRVAPQVYEKLEKVAGDTKLRDYNSVHPSGEKRAQLLHQAVVMEEALSLYHEAVAERGVEGFEINTSTDCSFSSWES